MALELESKGATGYGPDYVTLQRYFQLRGTTDQSLRDVFDDWLQAAPGFWELVRSCHEGQSKSRSPWEVEPLHSGLPHPLLPFQPQPNLSKDLLVLGEG